MSESKSEVTEAQRDAAHAALYEMYLLEKVTGDEFCAGSLWVCREYAAVKNRSRAASAFWKEARRLARYAVERSPHLNEADITDAVYIVLRDGASGAWCGTCGSNDVRHGEH